MRLINGEVFSIFRHGRLVVDGDSPWAGFNGALYVDSIFDFADYSVVVFEGATGGNNVLHSWIAVVVTPHATRVVHHPDFAESPGDFEAVPRANGVVLDFGFRARTRRAFLLSRRGLVRLRRYRPNDATHLTQDQCETLRDIVGDTCVGMHKWRASEPSCSGIRIDARTHEIRDFEPDMHSWRLIRWVNQHPALEAEAFRQRCEMACRTGQATQALDGFEPAVCHRAPSTTQGATPHPPS